MRAAAVLIALCACNEIYDLESTRAGERGVKRECPSPSTTVPTYAPELVQLVARPCFWYSADETERGVAVCFDDTKSLVLEEGSGGKLSPMTITPSAGDTFDRPRLAPEGDLLLVRQLANGGTLNRTSAFRRDGGRWTYVADVVDAPGEFSTVGAPSLGPDRRVIHSRPDEYRELVEGADNKWTVVRAVPWSALGIAKGYDASLSPDGLRMTFGIQTTNGMSRMMYSERASKDDAFGTGRPIETIPDIGNVGFMTGNCERLYFSALGSVFYTNQY